MTENCFTYDPEGLERCLDECKVYLPENEAKHMECVDRCYDRFCAEDPSELDEPDEVVL